MYIYEVSIPPAFLHRRTQTFPNLCFPSPLQKTNTAATALQDPMPTMQLVVLNLAFVAIVLAGRPPYDPNAPKRGLPYNDPPSYITHFTQNSAAGERSQVSWAYNWGSSM
jgi:hypothetical protein